MKEKLMKLINVKTIITLVALVLWIYLTVNNIVDLNFFQTIFTMIISFYFGTQFGKKGEDKDENSTAG